MGRKLIKGSLLAVFGTVAMASTVSAAAYHYDDTMYNFPGYNVSSKEQIGTPAVSYMDVIINDSTNALETVVIGMTGRRVFDTLFVNTGGNGDGWHSWEYMVRDNDGGTSSFSSVYTTWDSYLPQAGVYGVAANYDYTLVPASATAYRENHPNGIAAADLTLLDSDVSFITWNGTDTLTYNFAALSSLTITMSDKFSLAYAPWCANDLVGTPVPEPATVMLVGTGLIGLAGAARRRKN